MTSILTRMVSIAASLLMLASCSLSDLGVGSNRSSDATSGAQFPNVAETPAPQPATPTVSPASARVASVYYAPIVGAPVNLVAPLSKRLVDVGRLNGIQPVPANTPGLSNELKGYFSAFSENGSTTIVHVWDVVAPGGQRVHRIQGQQTVPGASADPWKSVTPEAMAAIADMVMKNYVGWLKSGA